ncbi:CapD2 [Desulfamplus magnetovallimortis]|uniref:CapD2 n=1 Tax=Desulfamplus magnetovallimortis TaxID=1246637 RepID=A0A1W1HC73_9BACT|nr:nucleoside-diphosphate sugar epimerase/dehydratase [Desulfamplus magnetovallimortis]SLM30002.1 CapD2 [Desulfamplus magnetovallimortis]
MKIFIFSIVAGIRHARYRVTSRDMRTFLHKNFYLIVLADVVLITCALFAAYFVKFDFVVPDYMMGGFNILVPLMLLVKLPVFYFSDLYRGMWRYTSIPDLVNIVKASTVSTLVLTALIIYKYNFEGFSRSVFVIDWAFTIFFVSGFRLFVRFYFEQTANGSSTLRQISLNYFKEKLFLRKRKGVKNLLIIGAGNCGDQIFREIRNNPSVRYHVAGFLDDNPAKLGKKIHGATVLNTIENLEKTAEMVDAHEVLIAIPSADARQMRRIIDICEKSRLRFKTIPNMGELINGNVALSAIREISFRDLLGRKAIDLDQEGIGSYISGETVMVTGAGGSIGAELCRQICRFKPLVLILYERAETALYEIEYELNRYFKDVTVISFLADVQDQKHMEKILAVYRPAAFFHAAAYKHVPMLENHPWKAVQNNIMGTVKVVNAAKKFGVERFVFVSTDKAVYPTSVMGASKRIAEMYVQSQNVHEDAKTRFITVRFGNVAGSAGSVVPLFKRQIREGGPVTVTHKDVTRFFMTIPESCQLILQAGLMGEGGEIFILDMGTPVKIMDMARDMIRLHGLEPDVDIKIEIIGLRPGEKLFEELYTDKEKLKRTTHDKIMVLDATKCNLKRLNGHLDRLESLALKYEHEDILKEMMTILPHYSAHYFSGSVYPPN